MSAPQWYEADELNLRAKYGATTFSNAEVFMFGAAFINWIGTTCRVGHSNPSGLLDYTSDPRALGGGVIIRDFVDWTSGRDVYPGSEARLRELMDVANVDAHLANAANGLMGGAA